MRGADDVMEALLNFSGNALREPLFASTGYDVAPLSGENPADSEREAVLSCLSHAPINIDELIRACHLTVSAVQTILLELELAGRVRRLPGHRVSLISGDAEG